MSRELASAMTFDDVSRVAIDLALGGSIAVLDVDSDESLAEIDRGFVRAISAQLDQTIDRVRRSESMITRARQAEKTAERERRGRLRLEMLGEINETLSASRTELEIIENVANVVVPWLGEWCVAFLLPEGSDSEPAVRAATIDPRSDLIDRVTGHAYDPDAPLGVARVVRHAQPEVWPRLSAELFDAVGLNRPDRELLIELGWRSVVSVPLRRSDATIGALVFASTDEDHTYSDDELSLCEVVASRIASSVANRRYAARQREIATVLQSSLLPEVLPQCPRLDVATRYWAAGTATEVGGDFYDLFTIDERRSAAIIGDVCGTGPRAAALTSLARHTIRACLRRGDDAASALAQLNREILEAHTDRFITVAIVVLCHDEDSTEIEVTLAGHPRPIVVTAADSSTRQIGEAGTLLGVFDSVAVTGVTDRLRPGDVIALFTDGVTDVPPPYDLADDELESIIATSATATSCSEEIADGIQRRLESVLPIERREDDIALLVIRVAG